MPDPTPGTAPDYRLYYVLNVDVGGKGSGRDPLWLAREAALGGAGVVQLRGKELGGLALHHLACALLEVLRPLGTPLFIDDRLDVALSAGADGVHLGTEDLPFREARRVAPGLRLGVSCYGDLERARRAVQAGADYLAFGAMFPTSTKPGAEVVPLSVLGEARSLGRPVLAIGGISLENLGTVREAGADGVAVVSALQQAPSPRERARDFLRALEEPA